MIPRLPLPLRSALLAAMVAVSATAYSASAATTHTVNNLDDFTELWNGGILADGDTIELTDDSYNFSAVELDKLGEGVKVTIASDNDKSPVVLTGFSYEDMGAVSLSTIKMNFGAVEGERIVVGNMTHGSFNTDEELGTTQVIETVASSILSDTQVGLEDGAKLILGAETSLVAGSSISSGYESKIIEQVTDEETGIVTTTFGSKGTIDPPAIILGDGVSMDNSKIYRMMGMVQSEGDTTFVDSSISVVSMHGLISTVNKAEPAVELSHKETLIIKGGIDLSAGVVTAIDSDFSTAAQGEELSNYGGSILMGNGSQLTSTGDNNIISTDAYILHQGIKNFDPQDSQDLLPGTDFKEELGVAGNVTIGSDSMITGYDIDAEGTINIGRGTDITDSNISSSSVELLTVSITENKDKTLSKHASNTVGQQADIIVGGEKTTSNADEDIQNSTLTNVDLVATGGNVIIRDNTTIINDNELAGDIVATDNSGNPDSDSDEGIYESNITMKLNGSEYVGASGTIKTSTYGGNVVIGNNVDLTNTVISAQNQVILGNDVTYSGTDEDNRVYHISAYNEDDLYDINIIDTNATGDILNGTIIAKERTNLIQTGSDNSFTNCKSEESSSILPYESSTDRGGALYAHGNIIVGIDNTFSNNTSDSDGGAIFSENNMTTISTFVDGDRSVAVSTQVNRIEIGAGTLFENNAAAGDGGAIASGLPNMGRFDPDIEPENVAELMLSDGADIYIGKDVEFYDNISGNQGGAIFLQENRTLVLDSGVIFDGNTASGWESSIHASENTEIIAYVDAEDISIINDSITTDEIEYDPTTGEKLNSATFIQEGKGILVYGGNDSDENGFGGDYVQRDGMLVIDKLDLTLEKSKGVNSFALSTSANMGTSDTTYQFNGEGVALLDDNSTLTGDSAIFNGNSVLMMDSNTILDIADGGLQFNDHSSIGLVVTNPEGEPLDLVETQIGQDTVSGLNLGGAEDIVASNLRNSVFLTTTMTEELDAAGDPTGTYSMTQDMLGLATPMNGASGNIADVAKGMEAIRLGLTSDQPAYDFIDNLLAQENAGVAARTIQSVSGENIINMAWTANSAVKGFANLGRTQGAMSAGRSITAPVTTMDAKGSPISTRSIAKGRGNVWVGGLGNSDNQSSRDGIMGYKYQSSGYAVGGDYKINSKALIGASIGQTFGDVDDKMGLGSYDADALMAMLYGRYAATQKLSIDGYVAYGDHDYTGNSTVAGTRAHGSTNANSFAAAVYATWTESIAHDKAIVAPYAGLEFTTSKQDGFTESGVMGRRFGDARAQNWTLPVGVTLARTYDVGHKTTLTPSVSVSVAQDLDRMNPSGSVTSTLGTWNVKGVNVGRTALRANAGVSANFGNNWGARISYQLESRSGLTAQGINGAVSYSF
ncbi:MAG: autotransporter domain-containing protein [Akkermansia sp.]